MKKTIYQKKSELKRNMKIIAISGKHNTGKTQCLQKLVFAINNGNDLNCIYPKNEEKFQELLSTGNPVLNNKGHMMDFVVLAKMNNKSVGIITYGDNEVALVNGFCCLNEHHCDLYVCACRTHGETLELLKELSETGKLIVHNRWAVSEEQYRGKTIQSQVEEILREIEALAK